MKGIEVERGGGREGGERWWGKEGRREKRREVEREGEKERGREEVEREGVKKRGREGGGGEGKREGERKGGRWRGSKTRRLEELFHCATNCSICRLHPHREGDRENREHEDGRGRTYSTRVSPQLNTTHNNADNTNNTNPHVV